jgi:hypothetical protein
MTSTLKSQVLTTLFLSLMATLPVQAASCVVVNGDFENMGSLPYNGRPNALTQVSFSTGYGWQTTDIKKKLKFGIIMLIVALVAFSFLVMGGVDFLLKRMRTVLDFYISQFVCVKENR